MTAVDWATWVGYELAVAVTAFALTVFWFRRRATRAGLETWVALTLLAFFAALGLSQWLGAKFLDGMIAFGLASAVVVGAAVNAAYEVGLRGAAHRDAGAVKPAGRVIEERTRWQPNQTLQSTGPADHVS